jgi:hypothetical protein
MAAIELDAENIIWEDYRHLYQSVIGIDMVFGTAPSRCFVMTVLLAALSMLTVSCGHASVGAGVGYQPPVLPIRFAVSFSIGPDGSISVAGDAGLVTDIGTFSVAVDFSDHANPVPNELILVIRHSENGKLVDTAFDIAAGEAVTLEMNGRTRLEVFNQKVFVDASKGRITSLIIKNSSNPAGSYSAATPASTAPPPIGGDVPPVTDPGQVPVPSGATILGSVNLETYCEQNFGMHAVLRFPNTWGWRCSLSQTQASGERLGDEDISVDQACVQQYGSGATSHYSTYDVPSSWYCYRS